MTRPSSPAWLINRSLLETVFVQVEVRALTHPAPLTPLSPEADSAHGLAANVTLFGRCWYQGVEWVGLRGRRGPVPLSLVIAGGLEAASCSGAVSALRNHLLENKRGGQALVRRQCSGPEGMRLEGGQWSELAGEEDPPGGSPEKGPLSPRTRSIQAVSAPLHLFLSPAAVWPRVPKRTRHLASASHTCALTKPSQKPVRIVRQAARLRSGRSARKEGDGRL